ncbi:trichohyalin-like [Physella acuta]|uniref:trichohyalin-like n=1 Tax=Physella acuta TaxID=109671 RepID=UPI0027DB65E8|nr:trichohyalin-like [Physella acuta]
MSVNISLDDTPMGSIYFDGPIDDREEELERERELEAQEIHGAAEKELEDFFNDCSYSDNSTKHFYVSNHPSSRNVSQDDEDGSHFFTPPSSQSADKDLDFVDLALERYQRNVEEVNRMTIENLCAELGEIHSMERSELADHYKQEIQTLRQDLKSALTDLDKVKAMYVSLWEETRVQEAELKAKLDKQWEEQRQKVLEVKQKCQETHPGMIAAAVTEARQVWLAGTDLDLKIQDLKETVEELGYLLKKKDDLMKIDQERALKDCEMKAKLEIKKILKENEIKTKQELEKALKEKELIVKLELEKVLKEREAIKTEREEIQNRYLSKALKEYEKTMRELRSNYENLKLAHAKEIEKLTKENAELEQRVLAKKNRNALETMIEEEVAERVKKEVEKLKVEVEKKVTEVNDDEVEKKVNERIQELHLAWLKEAAEYIQKEIQLGIEEGVREERKKMKEEIDKNKETMEKNNNKEVEKKVEEKIAVELSQLNEQVLKEKTRLEQEVLAWRDEAKRKMEASFASKLAASLEERLKEEKKRMEDGTREIQEEEVRRMSDEMKYMLRQLRHLSSLQERTIEKKKIELQEEMMKCLRDHVSKCIQRSIWGHEMESENKEVKLKEPEVKLKEPEVKLKEPGVKLKEPGVKLKEPGVKLKEPEFTERMKTEAQSKFHDPGSNAIIEQKDQYRENVSKVQVDDLIHIKVATINAEIIKRMVNSIRSKYKRNVRVLLSGQVDESTIEAVEQAIDILAKRLITCLCTPISATVEECKTKFRVLLSGQVDDCTSKAVEQAVDTLARVLSTSVFTLYSASSTPKSTQDGKIHHICTGKHSKRKTRACEHHKFDVADHQAENQHSPQPKDNSTGKNHEHPQLDKVVLLEDTYHTPSSSDQSSPAVQARTMARTRLHLDLPKILWLPTVNLSPSRTPGKNPKTSPQHDMKLLEAKVGTTDWAVPWKPSAVEF